MNVDGKANEPLMVCASLFTCRGHSSPCKQASRSGNRPQRLHQCIRRLFVWNSTLHTVTDLLSASTKTVGDSPRRSSCGKKYRFMPEARKWLLLTRTHATYMSVTHMLSFSGSWPCK